MLLLHQDTTCVSHGWGHHYPRRLVLFRCALGLEALIPHVHTPTLCASCPGRANLLHSLVKKGFRYIYAAPCPSLVGHQYVLKLSFYLSCYVPGRLYKVVVFHLRSYLTLFTLYTSNQRMLLGHFPHRLSNRLCLK